MVVKIWVGIHATLFEKIELVEVSGRADYYLVTNTIRCRNF